MLSLLAVRGLRFSAISQPRLVASVAAHSYGSTGLRCMSNNAYPPDTVVTRCKEKIEKLLKVTKVEVSATNDDPNGSHVSFLKSCAWREGRQYLCGTVNILCISEDFEGKNVVQRQRLVYKAIWEELQGPVHAVDSIIARTPKEAGI
eukprot:gene29212-35262_t